MRIVPLLFVSILFIAIQFVGSYTLFSHKGSITVMALGFLILAGFFSGRIVQPFNLPKITGYIIAGIFFGPYLLGFISGETISGLKFINSLALNIIAFTAGGELNLKKLKQKKKAIFLVILFRFVIIFFLTLSLVFLVSPWLPFLKEKTVPVILGIGLLFSVIQLAISPATTIAVITETESRGPVTDLALTVTVAMDVLVLIAFAVILSYSKILFYPARGLDINFLISVGWEIFGAIIFGIIIGAGVILYIKYINKEVVLFLVGLAFIISEIGMVTHTDMILICLTAGFIVENFSKMGEPFIRAIEKGSLVIYIIFFVIAGAMINFSALKKSWHLALLLVIIRLFGSFFSTWFGTKLAAESETTKKYGWTGLLGQAGVSLGLGLVIQRKISGELGDFISTIIFASIAINQIIGPIIFRWGLNKSGEIKAKL